MSFELKEKQRHKKPLEQLRERKRELHRLCRQEEHRLKEGWEYARRHSGALLFSGVAGWFFSKQKRSAEKTHGFSGGFWPGVCSLIRPFLH